MGRGPQKTSPEQYSLDTSVEESGYRQHRQETGRGAYAVHNPFRVSGNISLL